MRISTPVTFLGGALLACVSEGPATVTEEAAPAAEQESSDPPLSGVFRDEFERAELGPDWLPLSEAWRIEKGWLCVEAARNRGAWLKRTIPHAARIEFDAVAHSAEGDLKVELWGDGRSGATSATYDDATGYVAIFGGWRNSLHVLARLDEHAPTRMELALSQASEDPRALPVQAGNVYHFKFERKQGNILSWSVDGRLLFEHSDPRPLTGPGHDHFGFNDWNARVCYDNLVITPLAWNP